jgi:DNA-binding PadR family transcriptional regulator
MSNTEKDAELTFFSYEILGLVGDRGASAHDLLLLAKQGRMLAWAGESQYYTEPKRLAKLGYLSARKEPGKTRERTVYALTDKGLDALREYARTPVTFIPVKSDALQRLLICDLVGEDVTRASLATLRDEIADIEARLDAAETRAHALPHREKYLLIVTRHLRGLLALHEQLAEDVERELSDRPARRRAPSSARRATRRTARADTSA